MNVLVIGGAGYIGSHMVRTLDRVGHSIVVLDNLSTGHQEAVTTGVFIRGEMSDPSLVAQILGDHKIDAVMHFAANALVGESVVDPAKYYQNNVAATLNLLEAMRQTNTKKIVFSSSCAVYGVPSQATISETETKNPVNPYGFTKWVIERALQDYTAAYDFGFAALRYFNAAGASADAKIGEDHAPETHLIPIILQAALGVCEEVKIFGDDWSTPDGTCVRDYIHVDDLGAAHLAALERLKPGNAIQVNLGTGKGYSVRKVLETCRLVTNTDIPETVTSRRPGDPPQLVADARKAKSVLGWEAQHTDLEKMVSTAWDWHRTHPSGFGSKR